MKQKEFGGYLPLELPHKEEWFDQYRDMNVYRLNCGRSAIAAAIHDARPSKIYIPYYNCAVVAETVKTTGVPYAYYFLDDHFEPDLPEIGENEWLLFASYFGAPSRERIDRICKKFRRIIFDNTQAFFAEPVMNESCYNVYSCRKFFGVSDGAYLVTSKECSDMNYDADVSWERAGFLMKCIETGTNGAYEDSLASEASLENGIKGMSVLSKRILQSIDYEAVRDQRQANYEYLEQRLGPMNRLPTARDLTSPMVYPFYVEDASLRRKLIEAKVYIPQWWKYLLQMVGDNTLEAKLSQYLLPLPIDQRYSREDMSQLADLVGTFVQQNR